MPSGIIVKGISGFYYVDTGSEIYECKARGIFRKNSVTPLPGDRVSFVLADSGKKNGNINEVLPRRSVMERPAVANVDQLIAVIALKSPEPDFLLLDKLMIAAEKNGLTVTLCINKIDLDTEREHEKIVDAYCKTGYNIVLTSSKIDTGYDRLHEILSGRISVLAGQSGVGKSTILNRVMEANVMATGEISRKIERGRHTTRHAELIPLKSGGYLVDTPGFSSLELTDIPYERLQTYYPDFSEYIGRCRFNGCSHTAEPGCLVKKAAEEGGINQGRYERYVRLYNLLKQKRGKTYD